MSFEVSEPAQPNRININQIQDKAFSTAWKGYRIEDVRSYLAQVAFEVRELSMELEAARVRIEEMAANDAQSGGALSKQVLKAEETAAQILHDANSAAKALRDQARQHFESVRQKAEEEAKELLEQARSQSGTISIPSDGYVSGQIDESLRKELEQARRKAAEIIERSKAEGRAMIDQARDLRNEILADLRHKRSVLDSEIADLATRRIEAYQSLARAVQLISEAGTIIFSNGHEESEEAETSDETEPPTQEPEVNQTSHNSAEQASLTMSDPGSEKPRSPLSDLDRYQAAISSSQIEIGNHLEEGIVRVFHKEMEAGTPDNDRGAGEELPAAASENPVRNQQVGAVADNSVEIGLSSAENVDNPAMFSEGQAASQVASDEVVPDEDREAVRGLSDLHPGPTTSDDSDGGGVSRTASPVDRASEGMIQQESSAESIQPEQDVPPPVAENTTGSTPHSITDEIQRSRKADEILARIRSLRLGEQASDVSERGGEAHPAATAAKIEPVPTDASPEQTPPKGDSISVAGSEDLNEDDAPQSGIEEGGFRGSEVEGVSRETDAATQELLDVREELLAPVATMLFKKMKRLLSDEQNDLLDKVRRSSGSEVVLEKLLDEKEQIDALAIASLDFFEQVRLGVAELFVETNGSSVRRDISKQAVQYSEEFAKEVILPLRRRIEEALSVDVTAEDQSTAGALGAIYRDVRSNRLEPLISQYANTVFCATVMLESGYESFVWATDPQDVPCADCLDNALAGATMRGEQFPTGHYHPGIHSGCRCLLVPFIA
ncbi:MAG: DivIVA domain-containing protein [Actinomycetota bacterium]|nr:MAG: DivIVA domain-containing protein [Actinomycetota bacterium]